MEEAVARAEQELEEAVELYRSGRCMRARVLVDKVQDFMDGCTTVDVKHHPGPVSSTEQTQQDGEDDKSQHGLKSKGTAESHKDEKATEEDRQEEVAEKRNEGKECDAVLVEQARTKLAVSPSRGEQGATKATATATEATTEWAGQGAIGKEPAQDAAEGMAQRLGKLRRRLVEDTVVVTIRRYSDDVQRIRQTLATEEGWTLQRSSGSTRTYYRHERDAAMHTIRVEGWMDYPMFEILSILYEVDLHPQWMPSALGFGITESNVVHEFSPTKLWVEFLNSIPWPFSNRNLSLFINGVDCLDESESFRRQVVILMRSAEADPEFQRLKTTTDGIGRPPQRRGVVTAEMPVGAIVLTPAEINADMERNTGTFVQLYATLDPKVDALPACAVDLGLRNVAHFMIDCMQKQAAKVHGDEEYAKRIEAKPQFYGFIKRRMRESGYEEAVAH